MRKVLLLIACAGFIVFSCATPEKAITKKTDDTTKVSDTIRIADGDGYEIVIFEPGFTAWMVSNAQPRQYYTKQFLRTRNIVFVTEWNQRVIQPSRFDANLYEQRIDYRPEIDYGYEVNYQLYYYFVYFQRTYNQRLGTFSPRI